MLRKDPFIINSSHLLYFSGHPARYIHLWNLGSIYKDNMNIEQTVQSFSMKCCETDPKCYRNSERCGWGGAGETRSSVNTGKCECRDQSPWGSPVICNVAKQEIKISKGKVDLFAEFVLCNNNNNKVLFIEFLLFARYSKYQFTHMSCVANFIWSSVCEIDKITPILQMRRLTCCPRS